MGSIPLVDVGQDLVVEREQLLQLRLRHPLFRQGDEGQSCPHQLLAVRWKKPKIFFSMRWKKPKITSRTEVGVLRSSSERHCETHWATVPRSSSERHCETHWAKMVTKRGVCV